jgi:hypothetical protein
VAALAGQLITERQALAGQVRLVLLQALAALAGLTQAAQPVALVVLALALQAAAVAAAVRALSCCAGNNWWDNLTLT